MLGDEVLAATIRVTVQGAEVTADIIRAVLQALAEKAEKEGLPKFKRGLQSLKELNKQGEGLTAIPVTGQDMRALKKELKEYGVDFALTKGDGPDTTTIFFKVKDHEQFNVLLSNYLQRLKATEAAKDTRVSLKDRMQRAIEKTRNIATEKARGINEKTQKTIGNIFRKNKDVAR